MESRPSAGFYKFVLSSALSFLSTEMFVFAIPIILLGDGRSVLLVGWCTFAFFLPVVLARLFGGPAIESLRKKPVLAISGICRALVMVVLVALMAFDRALFDYSIVGLCFLFGLMGVFGDIAEPAVLKMLLPQGGSTRLLSKYEVRTRAVQLVGPALCGALLGFNAYVALGAIACANVFSVCTLAFIPLADRAAPKKSSTLKGIHEAVGWLRERKLFLIMVSLTAINNFLHPVLYLTVIYQLKQSGIADGSIGVVLSGLGAGGIIGCFVAPLLADRLTLRQTVIVINISRVFVFLGFVAFPVPVGMFLFFVLKAVLGGAWNVCYNVYSINEMPSELVARISALSGLIVRASSALGSIAAGYSISYLGASLTLQLLVMLTLAMLACSVPYKSLYPRRKLEGAVP